MFENFQYSEKKFKNGKYFHIRFIDEYWRVCHAHINKKLKLVFNLPEKNYVPVTKNFSYGVKIKGI